MPTASSIFIHVDWPKFKTWRVTSRAHSFPQAAEFRTWPWNSWSFCRIEPSHGIRKVAVTKAQNKFLNLPLLLPFVTSNNFLTTYSLILIFYLLIVYGTILFVLVDDSDELDCQSIWLVNSRFNQSAKFRPWCCRREPQNLINGKRNLLNLQRKIVGSSDEWLHFN